MFIIETIPIAKTIGIKSLSYFTDQEVSIGAIVDIPLRNKIVKGIVISIKPAIDMKSEIKKSSFALKKLGKIKAMNFFSNSFMETVAYIADYYASNIGSVMNTIVPDYILKNIEKLKINKKVEKINPNLIEEKEKKEKYAIQGDEEERYGNWKSLIRQEFARRKSIFFLFPTIEEAEYAFSILEKGIEGYAFLLHGSLGDKKIVETWNDIMRDKHPIIVIATGAFLSIPREDIESIVIERESNRVYRGIGRPYMDIRHFAEILAEKRGIKVFFSDNFLRLETLNRKNKGEIIEGTLFKWRSLSTGKDTLVDMRQYIVKKSEETGQEISSFKIISPEVEALIRRTKDKSERMIIFGLRKGLAPSTVCADCQNIVLCNKCSLPVVIHKVKNEKGEEKNVFMCHRCGERRSTEEYCKICGSWRLATFGIGIDLIEEKIKDKFKDIEIFRIDGENTPNDKSIKSIIQKYRNKPGSILLGGEMMLQYMHDKVENTAIISLDSLFSIPDFRIQEKILQILIKLRSLTSRDFIIQTRKSDEKVFEYGLKGNTNDFYKDTIIEREKFHYPPFTTLIKLTLEGNKDNIVKEMEIAQNILDPYEVEVFPAFTHTVKGKYVLHGLIRLQNNKWIDRALLEKLNSLSPIVSIRVDPEHLL